MIQTVRFVFRISPNPRPAGASLATTIVFLGLALVLGLALSSTSVSHLHFSNSRGQSLQALSAAESTLALAIEKILTEPGFGDSDSGSHSVEVRQDQAIGRLSFSSSDADDWGIPVSTNNRSGERAVEGWRAQSVPAEAIHLVASGESGGTRKIVEAVIQIPGFPYSMVSTGPIESRGGLIIGGVSSIEDSRALSPEELEPADLASNARGTSINLAGETLIKGSVKAVGDIALTDEVNVQGEVEPNAEPVELQSLDLQTIRPPVTAPLETFQSPSITEAMHFTAPQLTIRGGLELDDGILYVNGDLDIYGGVRGRGALLVNGSVTIRGGAALAAENQLAVVAMDDVVVEGEDRERSFFQGLVYTEGDLHASNITLLGTFVANGRQTTVNPGSRLNLENASALYLEKYTSFETKARLVEINLSNRNGVQDEWAVSLELEATPQDLTELKAILAKRATMSSDDTGNLRGVREELTNFFQSHKARISSGTAMGLNFGRDANGGTFVSPHRGGDEDPPTEMELAVHYFFAAGFRENLDGLEPEEIISVPAFRFDLNEFLNESDRMRVLLWREQ